jgi:hypothetical protein
MVLSGIATLRVSRVPHIQIHEIGLRRNQKKGAHWTFVRDETDPEKQRDGGRIAPVLNGDAIAGRCAGGASPAQTLRWA